LTAEQKRELLVKLVAAQPEKSDREIAKQAKVSHPTVAKARQEAEATGKALPVEKRVGKDGKARKQPAKKIADRNADAEQEKADKQECIRLWEKVQQAETNARTSRKASEETFTAEEADESYQDALCIQAHRSIREMTAETRQRFWVGVDLL